MNDSYRGYLFIYLFFKETIESVYKPCWLGTMGNATGDLVDQAAAAALETETIWDKHLFGLPTVQFAAAAATVAGWCIITS